jgi:hypothetical protein
MGFVTGSPVLAEGAGLSLGAVAGIATSSVCLSAVIFFFLLKKSKRGYSMRQWIGSVVDLDTQKAQFSVALHFCTVSCVEKLMHFSLCFTGCQITCQDVVPQFVGLKIPSTMREEIGMLKKSPSNG